MSSPSSPNPTPPMPSKSPTAPPPPGPSSVRVRLVTPPLGPAAREGRFGYGEPCPGHDGLRGPDTGAWAGRTLEEVASEDPAAVRRWLTDPSYAPPGGESSAALIARVGAHLAGLAPGTHRVVVEQAVVRAAVVHALELPAAAFWRLDVRPGTVTTLSGRAGRWNLLVGQPELGQPEL
ncbi:MULTISPECIES: histidine phosphatase family protein [unclassified Streptomyces]|uniref:histidine phosphatase family protein n=1 Tax=unclassified Streptomyces TaxID=2593676 RepID=UPI00224F4DDE|nr:MULTISPECIES: histidine phosphatase family protein [unclassified Streptomyces]MCX4526963.1 histidine phosphatase family protein [Streptomyces sp. NBC_01551]MCX4542477.1 histidine phosphatase family protein [Streptomyces sp. NBC_01565]